MIEEGSLVAAIQQYQKAYDVAVELLNIFEDSDPPELLRIHEKLVEEIESFFHMSGLDWSKCGNLGRHLTFLNRYLKKGDKVNCEQDIKDIVFFDLPAGLRNLLSRANDNSHFDQRLKDGVIPLMSGGHYDSAVRKVFVILTDRLRRVFGVTDQIDGEDLVNLIFGKKGKGGKLPLKLGSAEKQAMRNLVSGFYSVFRNRYAHNDIQPDLPNARAIIEMANTIILEIEIIAKNSAKQA